MEIVAVYTHVANCSSHKGGSKMWEGGRVRQESGDESPPLGPGAKPPVEGLGQVLQAGDRPILQIILEKELKQNSICRLNIIVNWPFYTVIGGAG